MHFGTWIASLQYASVAVSTLLVCSTPVFTEAWTAARTRIWRPLAAGSIALAAGGVAIVAGVPGRSDTPLGIGLALCGAVAMAVYLLLVRASDSRYSTLAVVGRTYPIAAVALGCAALLTHDGFPAVGASGAWAAIFALALLSQLFGHTALNAAVRVLSATFVATDDAARTGDRGGRRGFDFWRTPGTVYGRRRAVDPDRNRAGDSRRSRLEFARPGEKRTLAEGLPYI